VNPDFRDLLAEFNERGVEFLIVGAHALAVHGLVRATKDLDVWIRADQVNATRALAAIQSFGAPLHDLTIDDLSRPGVVFQIGVEPIRIDIITRIDGVAFDDAWTDRLSVRFGDQPAGVLSRHHLIANKRAAGREQDLVDANWLERNAPKS
jgi:hypothetical protein